MADTLTTPTPIFYEALAAAVQCFPSEAKEHFDLVEDTSTGHHIEEFLDEFSA